MSVGLFRNIFNLRRPIISARINFIFRQKHSTRSKCIYNMNEAYLRHEDGEETFHFTFHYKNEKYKIDRQFNLVRKTTEPVSTFLKRLDTNLEKTFAKQKKKMTKKSPSTNEELPQEDNIALGNIELVRNNFKINLDEPCLILFDNTSELTLRIFGEPYRMKLNVPWVKSISLPNSILVGFPTYPTHFETIHTDKPKSLFIWFINRSRATPASNTYKTAWEKVSEGFLYTPVIADVECSIKLRCIPVYGDRSGPAMEVESTTQVEAGPGECPFETRHSFTRKKLTGKDFRVTSYNILADTYASTDYSRDVLFSYCPPYALAIDYRKQLIIKELVGYNSDIICLQEVDRKVYETDLYPLLSMMNYDGVFNRKGDDLSEGISILWDERRFDKLHAESRVMSQDVGLPGFLEVWEKIDNDAVKERFLGRNTTVQATVLRSKENPTEILVVGNTHLYFQPDADHIRLLQGYYALIYCQDVANQIRAVSEDKDNINVLLCGDFNSTPDCGIYQLMTTNHVPKDHKDWKSNPEQIIENVSLSHKGSFASACGTPQYTNFTIEFADCLDYIFYQKDNLEVTQVVPLPSKEELSLNGAIPSVVFPSDHVALCADLKWTN